MDSGQAMDSELWSGLPLEIFPTILSFLSTPVLYRFRAVSKTWKSLICSQDFNSLHVQNAALRQDSFILGRRASTLPGKSQFSQTLGWRLLDVKESRWYVIDNVGHIHADTSVHSPPNPCFESRSHSSNGSLVCAVYLYPCIHGKDVRVVVIDPIAQDFATLPLSPYDKITNVVSRIVPAVTNLVVDNITQEFKVFVMLCALDPSRVVSCLIVYDSATDRWRRSRRPLGGLDGTRGILVRCTVFWGGFLYVVFTNMAEHGAQFWQLWRYSPVEDEWVSTGAASEDSTPTQLLHPQLIVNDNRLFLASWVTVAQRKTFELLEICLEEVEEAERCWTVFQVEESVMETKFRTRFQEETQVIRRFSHLHSYCFADSPDVAAFGIGKSIGMLARVSGVAMMFDLVNKCWDSWELPVKPCEEELWFGQPTDLFLHPRTFSILKERR